MAWHDPKLVPAGMKRCSKCELVKKLSEFTNSEAVRVVVLREVIPTGRRVMRLHGQCNECRNEQRRQKRANG